MRTAPRSAAAFLAPLLALPVLLSAPATGQEAGADGATTPDLPSRVDAAAAEVAP